MKTQANELGYFNLGISVIMFLLLKFNWEGDLNTLAGAETANIALVTAFAIIAALSGLNLISLHAKDPFTFEINPDVVLLVLYMIFVVFTSHSVEFYIFLGLSLALLRFFVYLYLKSSYSEV